MSCLSSFTFFYGNSVYVSMTEQLPQLQIFKILNSLKYGFYEISC